MGEKVTKNSKNYFYPMYGSLPSIDGIMLNIVRSGLSKFQFIQEKTKKRFIIVDNTCIMIIKQYYE